jgi:cytochrome P450
VTEVVLAGFDELRDAYRHKDLKQALYDEGGVVMADCLLTLHGEPHRARRRLENRLFRRETFRWFEKEVMPRTIDATLAPFLADGRGDLLTIGHRTTMNLTADIAGVDRPARTPEETEHLYGFVKKFSEGATVVHSTRDKDEVRAEVALAMHAFDREFFQPSLRRRQELVAVGGTLPNDVLTTLLVNADRLDLPLEIVRREIAFYLQAGSHSTANALTHALDDLWTWAATHPADLVRATSDRAFLQRCLHETMRLHPASPVAWRRAVRDIELRGGSAIREGTLVVLDIERANCDPAVWGPGADRYDPHRRVPDGVAPWGHSFGGGTHACIGAELDGGVEWIEGSDPGEHLYGTVTVLAERLLQAGARRDPDDPPRRDPASARNHFGHYPVVFS